MANNVIIDLNAREDSNGKTYFIGRLEAPVLIDCSKGVAFLIFISEKGAESLQIAPMNKKDND